MGATSSITDSTTPAAWQAVKDSVRGAFKGEVEDIAMVAAVAGVAAGSIPVSTGIAVAAGGELLGLVVDAFA